MAARVRAMDRLQFKQLGAAEAIAQPFDPQELAKAIAMAETLVSKVETKVENRDYFPSPDAKGRKIVPRLENLELKALGASHFLIKHKYLKQYLH